MYLMNTIKHTTRTAIDAISKVITSLSCSQLSDMASLKKCVTFDRERIVVLLNLYLKGKRRWWIIKYISIHLEKRETKHSLLLIKCIQIFHQ